MSHYNVPLAVTCGDPAGIGPDVLLDAYARRSNLGLPPFYVLGDIAQLTARADHLGLAISFRASTPAQAVDLFEHHLPVVALENALDEAPGAPSTRNGPGIIEAIERATADCINGKAAAMVTAPIAKSVLYECGFEFPGHTEFLGALAQRHTGQAVLPVMMIAGPSLRTVPVTIHVPLSAVFDALTPDLIRDTIVVLHRELQLHFAIASPRIAVAGLNPHAGESGTMGHEEAELIEPVLNALRAQGLTIIGPLPADTMFHAAARATYDVAVCMYHDQALIPAKTLAFDDGVNVTLGLPFIRTSPDHGTAFSVAGSGAARADSFIAALKMARQMADARHG